MTLLVGNSLLRDVRVDKTSNGYPIKIRRKSGATLADIEQMIDDAAKTETIAKCSSLVVLTKQRVT